MNYAGRGRSSPWSPEPFGSGVPPAACGPGGGQTRAVAGVLARPVIRGDLPGIRPAQLSDEDSPGSWGCRDTAGGNRDRPRVRVPGECGGHGPPAGGACRRHCAAGPREPPYATCPRCAIPGPPRAAPAHRAAMRLGGGVCWARRDPEDVRTVLQALYTACEEVIQRCDGDIAQYDSVGLLVYFGYPTADEAAAPLAVRAGLRMVEMLGMSHGAGGGGHAHTAGGAGEYSHRHSGGGHVGRAGGGTRWSWETRPRWPSASRGWLLQTRWWSAPQPGTWCRAPLRATPWGHSPVGAEVAQAYRALGTSGAQGRLEVGLHMG